MEKRLFQANRQTRMEEIELIARCAIVTVCMH